MIRSFTNEPWPPREEPEWDSELWKLIGTGSVPPKVIRFQ